MTAKTFLALPAIFALAACSGGGGGSSSPVASYSTLKVFSDGTGVGSGVAEDGSKVVFIAPEIAATVAEANDVTEQDIADINVSDFPVVQSLQTNANLREGTLTVNGVTANVTAVEDLGGEAGLVLLEIPNAASAGMATGSALTGNPVGTQTYSGTMTMGPRGVNSNQELGSFSMEADFDAETYTFSGTTNSNSVTGNGVIDIQSGTFSSNNLSAATNGTNRTATMYGQLHGNDAKSVSGVFHTNENSADYNGGFVGSRP
jgi:hypothetical protein